MAANDISEIVNALNLYGLAIDTLQWHLFDLVFTDDVAADYLSGAWSDLASWKRDFAAAHAPLDGTQHMVMNHVVIVSGDNATATCYALARLMRAVPEGGGNFWQTGAYYYDDLIRTPAGWRIKRRICRANWWEGNTRVAEAVPGTVFRPAVRRLRDAAAGGELAYLETVRSIVGYPEKKHA